MLSIRYILETYMGGIRELVVWNLIFRDICRHTTWNEKLIELRF